MEDNRLTDKKFRKELNSGTVALVLLAILRRANSPMYGYQIAKILDKADRGVPIKQGTLYPVLRSLESGGLLKSEVEPSVSGPPRRYYVITERGREVQDRWANIWRQTKTAVDNFLEGEYDDQEH